MSFEQFPQEYMPYWPQLFKLEAIAIEGVAADSILRIEHIGSTSIAGMLAKPIIDILVVVKAGAFSSFIKAMEKLNYTSKGENGIAGRRYFSRPQIGTQLGVHVHCFEEGHSEIAKHIAFRNYLISHPHVAKQYQGLKRQILATPEMTRTKYQELKQDFLSQTTKEALTWFAARSPNEKAVQKVVVYVLRKRSETTEVLVFDHVKFMEVSPQLPSGSVEDGEDYALAAKRELLEESGVLAKRNIRYLGSYVFYKSYNNQFQERHIFTLTDSSLEDRWTHTVTGTGEDQDLEFRYYWLPLSEAIEKLQANLGDGLVLFAQEIENNVT